MKRKLINKSIKFFALGIVLLAFLASSCKKFIEVEAPYTSLNGNNVYSTDATAISAVTAMYTRLGDASSSGLSENQIHFITYCAGLSADELTLIAGSSTKMTDYYRNSLSAADAPIFWLRIYS